MHIYALIIHWTFVYEVTGGHFERQEKLLCKIVKQRLTGLENGFN